MANQERGVYQPQEDFASYEDYPEEEGRSRLPLMIVIALVVLAAFGGVVWLAYNQGVAHGRAGAPPIVAAPAGPARTAPTDETQVASGSPSTPYTGLKIYGEPVPPDEEAADSALAPQTAPAAPPPAQQATPTPAAPEVQTAPLPPPAAPEVTVAHQTPRPAPSSHTVAPPSSPAVPEVAVATPEQAANAPSIVVAHPPRPQPQPPAHAPAQITPQPAPDVTPVPVATEPPPTQVASNPPPAAAGPVHTGTAAISGAAVLQVGSYPSSTLAQTSWRKMQSAHAGALSGLSEDIMTAQIPGKGTWYRLRIGPFATRAEAATKCAQLKAAGMTCIVSAP